MRKYLHEQMEVLRWWIGWAVWDHVGRASLGAVVSAFLSLIHGMSPAWTSGIRGAFVAFMLVLTPNLWMALIRNKPVPQESPLELFNGTLRWRKPRLKQIANRHLLNETVILDGVDYLNCVFENCTIRYEGSAPYQLSDCQLVRHEGRTNLIVASSNPIVMMTLSIQSGIEGVPPIRPLGWKFEPSN
jgi:hypothetical protein